MRKLAISHHVADRTIPVLLREAAERYGAAPYAIFPDATFSFQSLYAAARTHAKAYIGLGIRPGDHVATLIPNCADWLPAYYGALLAGATVVVLNARYKRHELANILGRCRARILVTTDRYSEHADFAALLEDILPGLAAQTDPTRLACEAAPDLKAVILCGSARRAGFLTTDDFLSRGEGTALSAVDEATAAGSPDDLAAIIYTSGTSSGPKGCLLSHGSIQNSWATFAEVARLEAGEGVWVPMPFFHTGGIGPITMTLASGAFFVTQPHYEPDGILDMIERHRVNHLYAGFPQLALPVVEHERFDRKRFSFVRSLLNVSPPATQSRIQNRLPEGAMLLNLFGMTEGSGIVTFTPSEAPLAVRLDTAGLPPPHTDVRIVEPETGRPCAEEEAGEIQFRGGGAFKGYHGDPEATAATILPGGWVRTGDRGAVDAQGYLRYLGRLKDMLKVGGENVAAAEIEAFLQRLPQVRLAQVIGIPDKRLGQVPIAFAETVRALAISEAEIIAFCDGQLSKWKVPRQIHFVTDWPMSATKVRKAALYDLLPGSAPGHEEGA